MDPGISVPPTGYGGHERLVYMYAKQYCAMGHQVDLLVSPGSEVEGCTIYSFGRTGFPPKKKDARIAIFQAWKFLYKNRNKYDLIHNFGRLIYLIPILNKSVRKIMTYGREISTGNIKLINSLPNNKIIFTGCSSNLVSRGGVAGKWQTVYNAIPFEKYTLKHEIPAGAPFIFLGRLERVKGCHTAIRVVKQLGEKLIIAGNVSPLKEEQEYFNSEIRPHIDDDQIVYVGQVDDQQKNNYLGMAKALLFPIEWDEPFGMVMTEAMACGTPVIGFRKGSVPEVIDEGLTGFVVNDMKEMLRATEKLSEIDRTTCREKAKSRFDVSVVAKNYLSLFE